MIEDEIREPPQKLEDTRTGWIVVGVVSVYSSLFITLYGIPGVPYFSPVDLGMTESPWFLPVMAMMTPMFLFLGLYAGYVFQSVFGGVNR